MSQYKMYVQDTRILGGLPIATRTNLGMIKVGQTLNITPTGVLDVDIQNVIGNIETITQAELDEILK